MEIAYLGHACFKLKGKNSVVVTDPFDAKVGKLPRDLTANLVTVSHGHFDHNAVDRVGGKPFVVNGPGEYEVGGVSIIGVSSWHDEKAGAERGENTIYVIEIDRMRVVHLGDLGTKLTQEQLNEIGGVDVALVPVGGTYTVDAKTAAEVVKQLDPSVVIPMHYKQPGIGEELAGALAGVDEFLKEMGKEKGEVVNKLSLSEDRMPSELTVTVLDPK